MEPHESAVLGRRLRSLRDGQWPGIKVTQRALASALGVVMSSVSSWESGKIPPPGRLRAYATFFATPRSVADGGARVLPDDELTAEERAVREALLREFQTLQEAGSRRVASRSGSAERLSGLWRFPGRGRARIFCGALDPEDRPPFAKATAHNYMQLSSYTDLDALVELFGHIRAANPLADVRFELAPRLESDDMKDHLVLLGSGLMNPVTRGVAELAGLPVRQVVDDSRYDDADGSGGPPPVARGHGEVFQLTDGSGQVFRPHVVKAADGDTGSRVVWDIGFFYRTPSPFNVDCTLTICSGVFTRGVYGAVRLFTDKKLREHNEAHVVERFAGATTFGLLVRVPVLDHATSTPDLRSDRTTIRAWADGSPVE